MTLEIASLKNKRNITLTCSAPAFCSGSKLQFTWMYQEAGKDNLRITDNDTEFMINMTENHTSSLTFKASPKHHNMNVTCMVIFPGNKPVQKTLNMSCEY